MKEPPHGNCYTIVHKREWQRRDRCTRLQALLHPIEMMMLHPTTMNAMDIGAMVLMFRDATQGRQRQWERPSGLNCVHVGWWLFRTAWQIRFVGRIASIDRRRRLRGLGLDR